MKIVFALCGYAGSGKDTACDYLVAKHGFRKTSFAAPLKAMAKIAFGFSDEQLYGPSSKREEQDERYPFSGICPRCNGQCRHTFISKYGPSPYYCEACDINYPAFVNARLALQTLGTEWGRRLTPNLWADAALNGIMEIDHTRWCISDLRFKNEFDAVQEFSKKQDTRSFGSHSCFGYNIRLMRGALSSNHQSETELATIPLGDFSMVLQNFGELDQLYAGLDSAVAELT